MSEISRPFQDGVGDGGPYSAIQWHKVLETLSLAVGLNTSVVSGILNELIVTSSGDNNITVAAGRALVEGIVYENDASEAKTTASPTTGTTGRRAVLRADYSTRTVRIAIISSSDGTASLPALTQIAGVTWEKPLANFTITTGGVIGALTDERYFVPPFIRRKATITTENNDATLDESDPDFYFYVEKNHDYLIEIHAPVSFLAASDFKSIWTVPAGATITGYQVGRSASVLTVVKTSDWTSALSLLGAQIVYDAYAIVNLAAASGKVQFQWAQDTAVAEDTSIEAGAIMSIRRINAPA